ncbi:hypothetical protein DPMN_000348 [Dreissena polymorpha]|uniref:Myb/SANT-like DNA-binding domain-containing protein n=2 Tax=Dreissena polymorpha TaxID=45954 RepID=A0A9D4MH70_DREPO|nr:hypothetical protein DPMN_000348 [Dreissena polymorpha]
MEAKPKGVSILYPRKARSANWTEREKMLLVQTILEHEEDLFSRHNGGASRDLDSRHKSWADLQELLNQQLDVPRSVDQIKKAFENIKCRAKLKVDVYSDENGDNQCKNTAPSVQLIVNYLRERSRLSPAFDSFSMSDNSSTDIKPNLRIPFVQTTQEERSDVSTALLETPTFNNSYEDSSVYTEDNPRQEVSMHVDTAHNDCNGMTSSKRMRAADEYLELEVKRIKAELVKIQAETDLVFKRQTQEQLLFDARMKQEYELFELKKKLLQTQIENSAMHFSNHT